jgi:hypothetical protein
MTCDEGVAERLRDAFTNRKDVTEKKMFGASPSWCPATCAAAW